MIATFNFAQMLLDRNLPKRAGKTAFVDDRGSCTYGELDDRVARFAGHLRGLGLGLESRIMICIEDGVDFVTCVLGAIRAGVVPVIVNTILPADDYAYLLDDSRCSLLIASPAPWAAMASVKSERPFLRGAIVAGEGAADAPRLAEVLAQAQPSFAFAATRADEACLWQYSSGTTGRPKGTMHSHAALAELESLYPRQILGIRENDVTFSAAKLFFGYGFGNGLVFPMLAGATAILMAERPTPDAVFKRLQEHQPTIFFGVPTLYNSMLAAPDAPTRGDLNLRLCTSAGEALPDHVGKRWKERYGIDILDGIGSTEMLHIFLSNRPDDVRYGTTGRPLEGIDLRLLGEDGTPVLPGEIGDLQIRGPTAALGYWCNRAKSQAIFRGEWVSSGDKFRQDADGRYVYCGRSDDMLKVSGIYVSPIEVENALVEHPYVIEAAVVGWPDDAGLTKVKAFVVLADNREGDEHMVARLQAHVKSCLAPYKYPRSIEFLQALPKTVTGKVERYKLRRPA